MCEIFSLVPSRNLSPEKIETNQVITFQFLNDKIDKKTPILPNCQVPNGFFWYNCKFYYSKIEK